MITNLALEVETSPQKVKDLSAFSPNMKFSVLSVEYKKTGFCTVRTELSKLFPQLDLSKKI
jgi:hypothetical protein